MPRSRIKEALQAAGKASNTPLDADLAREVAYRTSVRAVLEGSIGRMGSGHSIVLRVMDADTARVLVTERGTAKSDDALIRALGELAERLRSDLGEFRAALLPPLFSASLSFEIPPFASEQSLAGGSGAVHRRVRRGHRDAPLGREPGE